MISHDETMPKLDIIGVLNPRPLYETVEAEGDCRQTPKPGCLRSIRGDIQELGKSAARARLRDFSAVIAKSQANLRLPGSVRGISVK